MTCLTTPRLTLRRLTVDDDAFILELVTDPEWLRFIGDRGVTNRAEARAYLEAGPLRLYERPGFGLRLLERRDDGAPLGICGLIQRDHLDHPDLGFALLPAARGQGYAREAALATLTHARETVGLRRLLALTHPGNARSIGLLESLGFHFERTIRHESDRGDSNLYALDLAGEELMDTVWIETIHRQFGAAIDMLENAMRACPVELWGDRTAQPEYWYTAYHTIFWLDLYLTGAVEGYQPPPPFDLAELDPAGLLPDRVYAQAELLAFLEGARTRLGTTLAGLTDERARVESHFGWGSANFLELLLYNLRHVQHHTGQLNLLLRQHAGAVPGWVAATRMPLPARVKPPSA